ncbi:MAG: hypothetical protein ACRDSN_16785, partial [Pseudonocardiaceae bacterium]
MAAAEPLDYSRRFRVKPTGSIHGHEAAAPPHLAPERRSGPRKDVLRRRLLFLADALCMTGSVGVTTLVEGTSDPLWALAAFPFWMLLAKAEGLYDADHPKMWHLTSDEAPAIFHWVTLSVAGTLFYIRALPDVTLTVDAAFAMWATALVGAFVLRTTARVLWRGLVRPERALVIGDGQLADQVRR